MVEISNFMFSYMSMVSILPGLTTSTEWPDSIEHSYISLTQDILNRSVIKHKIPPGILGYKTVSMEFYLIQILHVNEIRQYVSLSTLITLRWSLPKLGWNPRDYGNITHLVIDSDMVWTPYITLPKSTDVRGILSLPETLTLSQSSFVGEIPSEVETVCNLDLTNFPFDEHNCSITFIEMSSQKLVPFSDSSSRSSNYFDITTEWILEGYSCSSIHRNEGADIHYMECWFKMKRRSLFYIVSILIPLLLIAFTTHLVFIIPAESGEKVTFIVSLFVSMTMFLNYARDIIPRSMNHLPRLIKLLGAILANMVLSMMATLIVIRVYHRNKAREQLQEKTTQVKEEKTAGSGIVTERCEGGNHRENNPVEHGQSSSTNFVRAEDLHNGAATSENSSEESAIRASFEDAKRVTGISRTTELNTYYFRSGKDVVRNVFYRCQNITHSKLDIFFFAFFLLVSTVVYCEIFDFVLYL